MECKVDLSKGAPILTGYSLIIAFPSTGLVGVIAAKHLVDKLKMQPIGCMKTDLFAPIVLIKDGYLQDTVRVYVSKKHKLAIILSEQILHKFEALQEFSHALADWIKVSKIKKVFSLSGILVGEEEKAEDKVYGVGVNDEGVALLKKWNVEILKEGLSTGISPLILLNLSHTKIEAVQLLGEIKYNRDYHAAAAVVKKLSEQLKLKVDVSKLEEESKTAKDELTKQIGVLEQAKAQFKQKPQDNSMIYR